MNDPEFPRFVFCIPPAKDLNLSREIHDLDLKEAYETQLVVNHSISATQNYSMSRPVFKAVNVDFGYAEATGFDTFFQFCFKIDTPTKYHIFYLDPKLERFLNSNLFRDQIICAARYA